MTVLKFMNCKTINYLHGLAESVSLFQCYTTLNSKLISLATFNFKNPVSLGPLNFGGSDEVKKSCIETVSQ